MDFTNRPDERYEVRLSGTGGQGIITAGMIIAETCALYGAESLAQVHKTNVPLNAVMTQSYGPEARGGACKAELVFSLAEIDAPKPEKVDLLLALSQEAYDKYRHDVKEWGLIIVDSSTVKYEAASNVFAFPFTTTARDKVGFAVTANIVAVGYIAGLTFRDLATPEQFKAVIAKKVPPGTEATNYKAFDIGFGSSMDNLKDLSGLSKYMNTGVVVVPADMPVEQAVKTAVDNNTEAVFITDKGRYIGHYSFFRSIRAVARELDLEKTPVSKIMLTEIPPLTTDKLVEEALDLMEETGIRILAVVDGAGKLVGYLSYYQIQEVQQGELELDSSLDFIAAARTMITGNKWSALKTVLHNPPKMGPEGTVTEAAKKMFARRSDSIAIVNEKDEPIGIFTERDLNKRVIAKGLNPDKTVIEKVMTKRVITMSTATTIIDAYERMIAGKFHHIPVVGSTGKMKGVVTMQDIAHIINAKFYLHDSMGQEMPTTD
ncbi:MAG: CBS domain-containing protein [Candidatus Brocadiia bacterium]